MLSLEQQRPTIYQEFIPGLEWQKLASLAQEICTL